MKKMRLIGIQSQGVIFGRFHFLRGPRGVPQEKKSIFSGYFGSKYIGRKTFNIF